MLHRFKTSGLLAPLMASLALMTASCGDSKTTPAPREAGAAVDVGSGSTADARLDGGSAPIGEPMADGGGATPAADGPATPDAGADAAGPPAVDAAGNPAGGDAAAPRLDGNGAVAGDAGLAPSLCPPSLPAAATACPKTGLVCYFGDDPRGDLQRNVAICPSAGLWQVIMRAQQPLPPAAACGGSRDMTEGSLCGDQEIACTTEGVSCVCSPCGLEQGPASCNQTAPRRWRCPARQTTPGCPDVAPNLGLACNAPSTSRCLYRCSDQARVCTNGVWIGLTRSDCR